MSKIYLPKVVRPIDLAQYSPEMAAAIAAPADGQPTAKQIWMWANPTETRKQEYRALQFRIDELLGMMKKNADQMVANKDARDKAVREGSQVPTDVPLPYKAEDLEVWMKEASRKANEWWAEMWSQHADPATHWTPEEVGDLGTACAESDPGFWEWIHHECWKLIHDYRAQAKKS